MIDIFLPRWYTVKIDGGITFSINAMELVDDGYYWNFYFAEKMRKIKITSLPKKSVNSIIRGELSTDASHNWTKFDGTTYTAKFPIHFLVEEDYNYSWNLLLDDHIVPIFGAAYEEDGVNGTLCELVEGNVTYDIFKCPLEFSHILAEA